MPSLETIQLQPDFPNEDLDDENVPFVEHNILTQPESGAYVNTLSTGPNSMVYVYRQAHCALRMCGIDAEYTKASYQSFLGGFADFEQMSLLVRPRPYDGKTAVRRTKELLVDTGDLAEVVMSDGLAKWKHQLPNAYGVIINHGDKAGESMKEIQARTAGAYVACVLQRIV